VLQKKLQIIGEQVSARGVNLMANASAIRGLKISAIDKAYGSGGSKAG
jgi:hypothetical protein